MYQDFASYLSTWSDDPVGQIHLATALLALATGLGVLLLKKGRGPHKPLGYAYVAAMAALNLTALIKYDLTGSINMFHAAALGSLFTLAFGFAAAPAFNRKKGANAALTHGTFMVWSYYGLVVALVAEVFTRALPFMLHGEGGWIRFSAALFTFMAVTGYLTALYVRRALTPWRRTPPQA